MGWGVGVGRELKAVSSIHWNRKIAIVCLLMEVQKGTWCTCLAKKVIGSSFTPTKCVALLVHPSGTVHPTVDCHGFTSMMPVKADPAICSSVNGVSV